MAGRLPAAPVPAHLRRPLLLEPLDRAAHVGDLLRRRPAPPALDLGVAPGSAAFVAIDDVAAIGGPQHPRDAVGVAGEVGEDVTDRPVRQAARRLDVQLTAGDEPVEHRQEAAVGGRGAGDVACEPALVHRRTLRARLVRCSSG